MKGCSRCGGTIIGDGYRDVRRCENAHPDDVEGVEPDANAVLCRVERATQTRILDASAYSKAEMDTLGALVYSGWITAEQVGQRVWGKANRWLPALSVLRRLQRMGLAEALADRWARTKQGETVFATL
jgi:hypothetical protein